MLFFVKEPGRCVDSKRFNVGRNNKQRSIGFMQSR